MKGKFRHSVKRRYHVSLRPKRRRERNRKTLSVLGFLFLGGLAFITWKHLKSEALVFKKSISSFLPPPKEIKFTGVSDSLQSNIFAFLKTRGDLGWRNQGVELNREFPYLSFAVASRDFFKEKMTYAVVLRQPLGLVQWRGQLLGYLGDQGVVFKAPQGLYSTALPEVQIEPGDQKKLSQAALFLKRLNQSHNLPSPLASLRYVSRVDGWDVTLQDGTVIFWGDFRWTAEKTKRLGLVLADAKTHSKKNFLVDLRSFEDGKIFIKPEASLIGDRRF